MKVLLTGAGGFCGRHLARFLKDQGVAVYTLGLKSTNKTHTYKFSDVTDIKALAEIVSRMQPDYILHLAGVTQTHNPIWFYRINVEFAVTLFKALQISGFKRCPVLLVGTSAEYGNVSDGQLPICEDLFPKPYSHYGISKFAQTMVGLHASRDGQPVVIVRPFNIIGPGMPKHLVLKSIARQIGRISKGEVSPVIKVGSIKSTRDFIAVDDVVRIYWKLIQSRSAYGEIINICTGIPTSIDYLLTKMIGLSGIDIDVEMDSSRVKTVDPPAHYGSVEKLKRTIGYVPKIDLNKTLNQIWEETALEL